ncbi:type II toxin-antitoxin system ParD family antitoxin [Sphingomonas sp. VNH70]|uniref:type II toxin-antitoxin system ParD family antitoxin n=1 Tax=Sphingomonas silueang TaxID=3156617 RepID=UPI0032B4E614
MAHRTSVTIDDHFDGFIRDQISAGRYGSASDVVRAGLRLLEAHEDKVEALREALRQGEASGEPQPFDLAAFKAGQRRKLEAR